jgi:hypothetical protein
MQQQVCDNNIYRWAGMLLSEAAKLMGDRQWEEAQGERHGLEVEADQAGRLLVSLP